MILFGQQGLFRTQEGAQVTALPGTLKMNEEVSSPAIKAIGWASLAVAVAAIGLYLGRELRDRYNFQRRTPYDFYSHAGDQIAAAEYGVGV